MADVQRGQVEDIIRDTVHGVTECLENGHKQTKHTSPSIFMAPDTLRSLSPSSFQPQVVSIGPLHRTQPNLQAFEVKKAEFVGKLLDRQKPDIPRSQTLEACVQNDVPRSKTLKACVQKVAASIDQIRACYPSIKTYTDVDLAKMMVMDACFILEFLHPFQDAVVIADPDEHVSMYLSEDSTKDLHLNDPHIPYDLVLLENQIPFFVLNDIFDIFHCTISIEGCSLTEYINPLLKLLNPIPTKIHIGNSHKETPHHILGLLYHYYMPKPNLRHIVAFYEYSLYPKKRSAIELDQAGVNFKRSIIGASWPMAMNVEMHRSPWSWVRPTLRMPKLIINHFTELVLRNLIAYEQYSSDLRVVSSYAMAMDMLIDTQEDIARLVKSKVIDNHLGTNQDAANMINNICKQVSWGAFPYNKQWKQLDSHCNTYWPSKILLLKRTYFNSPWSIIALLTAIGLFVLTLIQTVCTLIQTVYTIT